MLARPATGNWARAAYVIVIAHYIHCHSCHYDTNSDVQAVETHIAGSVI